MLKIKTKDTKYLKKIKSLKLKFKKSFFDFNSQIVKTYLHLKKSKKSKISISN